MEAYYDTLILTALNGNLTPARYCYADLMNERTNFLHYSNESLSAEDFARLIFALGIDPNEAPLLSEYLPELLENYFLLYPFSKFIK